MRLLMWQVYGFQRIIDKNRSAVFFTAERFYAVSYFNDAYKTDKPPSERRGQRCLYDMLCKLLQQCDLADKRKLFSLSLCGVDDTHNHKYQSEDTAYCA